MEQAKRNIPYTLMESPNGDVHIQIDDKIYSPPEISAFVLQKLKAAAEDYLGEAVDDAIITVPAYFNDPQRQATRDAGLIAGLKVSRIINEPTAAALAYGLKNAKGQFVAVYDLGGGTFDISILELAEGLFQVRSTGGDTFLGGEDFDQRVIDWLIDEFKRETNIDLRQDRMALQRLKEAAEKAKCELSTAQQTEIVLPFISADASGPKHLNTVLSRQKYEALTDDLLERTVEPCRRALADAGLKAGAGGRGAAGRAGRPAPPRWARSCARSSARRPTARSTPTRGSPWARPSRPGSSPARSRSWCSSTSPRTPSASRPRTARSRPLIERNSTIPTRKSRVFTTVADNQTKVEVHVLQGESDMAAYNKSLAKFELSNIPQAPKGVPQLEVTFEIDVNGIVSVSAQDQATGRSQSMVIHPSGGLSQSELGKLVNETRVRDQSERTRKEQEAVVRQLDGLVTNTMRSVQALEGKLTSDEQDRILAAMERAKKARAESDLEELKSRLAEMEKAASLIGQAMLRP